MPPSSVHREQVQTGLQPHHRR
ncbi:Succinate--CoA ligase [ADP-forming] subunit beta [Labeo rohita]|uniref:Succinate--CoA ligase [ADP-forming] subunit beta n=1 Tax=Labeo rohita TaxID=84645 RepID=A0ABQ8M0J7_LABRO|nr:Succinate--CoA ligase [ADP-forming] subunit beta [Labeo rohita]